GHVGTSSVRAGLSQSRDNAGNLRVIRRERRVSINLHECAPSHTEASKAAGSCVDTTARIVRFCIRSDQGKLAERRGRKASGTGPYFEKRGLAQRGYQRD